MSMPVPRLEVVGLHLGLNILHIGIIFLKAFPFSPKPLMDQYSFLRINWHSSPYNYFKSQFKGFMSSKTTI